MTTLTVFSDQRPDEPVLVTREADRIAAELSAIGVRFERWRASRPLAAGATSDDVIDAYRPEIERLKAEQGYTSVDVVRMNPDHPDRATLRTKFLSEHTHSEDEVRFFVEGAGAFYLRVGGKVFQIVCERDDLLSVPAGITHWFDMGPSPSFTAIRLFEKPEGWVAQFTGDAIADRFPRYGETGGENAGGTGGAAAAA